MRKIVVMLLVAVLAMGVSFDASAKGKSAKRGKAVSNTTNVVSTTSSGEYLLTQIGIDENYAFGLDLQIAPPAGGSVWGVYGTLMAPRGGEFELYGTFNTKTRYLKISYDDGFKYEGYLKGNVTTLKETTPGGTETVKVKIKKL